MIISAILKGRFPILYIRKKYMAANHTRKSKDRQSRFVKEE